MLVNIVLIRYYRYMKTIQIYNFIERLSNLLRTDARRGGAEFSLLPIQVEVLHYLSICNKYSDTPMAVTTYLGQTKGTVSQTLKILSGKELLTKKIDSKDKRVIHLKLSSSAKALLKASIPTPLFVRASKLMNEQSHKRITAALNELLQAIQQANGMKTFGVCSSCRHNQKGVNKNYICGLTKDTLSTKDIQLICIEHEDAA